MTATMTDRVAALIRELDQYPEQRAEIIFELAAELERAGRSESALEWLRGLVDDGGVDGALARVEIAGLHFAAGRADLAVAELAKIVSSRLGDAVPYASAAELLAERGDDEAAVRWFTTAASRLTAQERAAARGEYGWGTWAYSVLWQRRQARERLGLAPDDLDLGLVEPPGRRMSSFPSLEQARADGRAAAARLAQILVWPQVDFALAQQRWPDLLDAGVSFEEYRARLESQLRDLASGCTTVQLVEARVGAMQAYADRGGRIHRGPRRPKGLPRRRGSARKRQCLATGPQCSVLVRQLSEVQEVLRTARQLNGVSAEVAEPPSAPALSTCVATCPSRVHARLSRCR
jgi:hypothetical protein